MSKDPKDSSGVTPGSGGNQEDENLENKDAPSAGEKKDSVSYETYQKLLGEKKKASERLAALEKEKAEREEADLKAKDDHKALLEIRDKELKEAREKLEQVRLRGEEASKLRAILDGINGSVEKEYYSLLPTDKVVIDPDTGLPDPASVREAVKIVETKFGKIIAAKGGTLPPNDAAKGGAGRLTYDQWMKLPDAEKPSRMKDVDKTTM